MSKPVRRFEDMKPDPLTSDTSVQIEQIIDMDLKFQDFQLLDGKHGEFAWIVAYDPETKKTVGFSTGAKVVLKKLKEAKKKGFLPLMGKITKDNDYYDII